MSIPIITFKYLNIINMENTCKILTSMPRDICKSILTRYASVNTITNDNEMFVSIPQLVFDDMKYLALFDKEKYKKLLDTYKSLVNNNGYEFMDLILVRNTDQIIKSINDFLIFASDKLKHTDTLQIEFLSSKDTFEEYSSMPNLIYSGIQQNFNIKDQKLIDQNNIIIIERRRIDNVDNAN